MTSPTNGPTTPPKGGTPAQPPGPSRPPGLPPGLGRRLVVVALLMFGLNYWLATVFSASSGHTRIPYSPVFLAQLSAGNVESVTSEGTALQGVFRRPIRHEGATIKDFSSEIPEFADSTTLFQSLRRQGVILNAKPIATGTPWWETLLFGFAPTILLVALFVWAGRRIASAGGGGLSAMGRSKARRYQPEGPGVTFADVAGIDEAKAELTEVVDFLKQPHKYTRLGGRVPRGVLLSGPPGTGKTLLARAVAGEANVAFFSMSASEFIEMIVGVGASRVRDLFTQAKQAAPAIVFIDELDAIGRARGVTVPGLGGGHDEREQTLNQILTEMDGFDPSVGVIVLASTNRPDVLDPALLRPGRFDRRIAVQPPDKAGRAAILRVHTRGTPLADDVALDQLAASTPGMVGADLANLVNEAALTAAQRAHNQVERRDFTDALEKVLLGAERKIVVTEDERRRTAYHEAGHAIVGMLTPGADPVRKVSIIPRGMALGVTFSAPASDRFNYDREYLLAKIRVALGGRVAEELVYGNITTGAESDIQQLTLIARQMVGRWGMSEQIGPIAVLPPDQAALLAGPGGDVAPETRALVDREVRRIVDESYHQVTDLLDANRSKLDALAHALLIHETLDQADAYATAEITPPAEPSQDSARRLLDDIHALEADANAVLSVETGPGGRTPHIGAGGLGRARRDGDTPMSHTPRPAGENGEPHGGHSRP